MHILFQIGDMSLPEGNEIQLKLGIAKQTLIKVKVADFENIKKKYS